MLHQAQLDISFWAEAVCTAVYPLNQLPTQALHDMTPYQALFHQKPALRHIRIFGCPAYVHVPKEKGKKIDSQIQKCVFIRYIHNTTKIYQV
jgi:hypothetical protein